MLSLFCLILQGYIKLRNSKETKTLRVFNIKRLEILIQQPGLLGVLIRRGFIESKNFQVNKTSKSFVTAIRKVQDTICTLSRLYSRTLTTSG